MPDLIKNQIIVFVVVLLLCSAAHAQPSVTNEADPQVDSHSVIITFLQDDPSSMNGCHYNLFAATKRSHLKKLPGQGLSIATFLNYGSVVQIIASKLKHLQRASEGPLHRHKVKFYLRTLISCPDATNGYGEIISFSIPTYKKGNTSKQSKFLLWMKYHMQYYNP